MLARRVRRVLGIGCAALYALRRRVLAATQPAAPVLIAGTLAEKGLTLVPMRLYFKDGKAKVQIGLARGKRTVDKRADIKKREHEREMERARRRFR